MTDLNPVQHTPYLTVVPRRQPEQKIHKTLGHAKSAITNQIWYSEGSFHDMKVYVYDDGAWQLIYDIPKGTRKADLPWH